MRRIALFLATGVLLAAAGAAASPGPQTLDEALARAAGEDRPVLIDFFTTWCPPCKRFEHAAETDADVRAALDRVVLFETDAEKEGLELAAKHGVEVYPTFLLLNAKGQPVNRWSGYGKEYFLEVQGAALADLTTLEEKRARFAAHPGPEDAETLARVHESRNEYRDAVALYRKAVELGAEKNFDYQIFTTIVYGVPHDAFRVEDARRAADALVAGEGQPAGRIVEAFDMLSWLEKKVDSPGLATPYLEKAIAAANAHDELAPSRPGLAVERALRIEKDGDRAFELKLASMPEGWKDDPDALNAVAWWCFENRVHLEEAEALAKRGVELAPAGSNKAAILDTLAEICNARGNCFEAVVYARQAAEMAPGRDYYRRQVERFEALATEAN
jgi:thiol-disulfide isomerase/thioredoxin